MADNPRYRELTRLEASDVLEDVTHGGDCSVLVQRLAAWGVHLVVTEERYDQMVEFFTVEKDAGPYA